jgi:SRSO17 transposase
VAADSVYGTGDIETMLCKAGKGYVLGVAANHVFRSWGKKQLIGGTAAKIAQSLPKSAWRRLSSGEGTKGPRLHDWAYLELADLDVAQYNSTLTGQWTRGLLIRRNIADGAMAFLHLVPQVPGAALIVIEAEFVLGGLEAVFDGPATAFHRDQFFRGRAMAGIGTYRWSCSPSP